jgi:hypothetical protein
MDVAAESNLLQHAVGKTHLIPSVHEGIIRIDQARPATLTGEIPGTWQRRIGYGLGKYADHTSRC